MACGCPTEPDGLWDANKIRVVARLLRDGKVEEEIPMTYAGVQNTFHVNVPVTAAGPMELQVLALDPGSANFGMIAKPSPLFHKFGSVTFESSAP